MSLRGQKRETVSNSKPVGIFRCYGTVAKRVLVTEKEGLNGATLIRITLAMH